MGVSCQGTPCSNYDGVYELTQVGDFCRWLYTSGLVELEIICEFGNWWLTLSYNDHYCAQWTYPLHGEAASCPPTGECIWIWNDLGYGCAEGVAETDSCPT